MPATKTMNPSQAELPFALLDLHGRTTLTVKEIADLLSCHPRHVCNLISEGSIVSISIGLGKSRIAARVPVEAFRDFVIRSMTCPWEQSPLRSLPTAALVRLHRDLSQHLRAKGVRL